jgi:hypothetical protein
MNATRPQSAEPENAELTPEQRREGERNLARLLVIAKKQGVPVAIQELQRLREEKRKAQNSQRDATPAS